MTSKGKRADISLTLENDPIFEAVILPAPSEWYPVFQKKVLKVKEIAARYGEVKKLDAAGNPTEVMKKIDSFAHAMLFATPEESLDALIEHPHLAEIVCDDARSFQHLAFGKKYTRPLFCREQAQKPRASLERPPTLTTQPINEPANAVASSSRTESSAASPSNMSPTEPGSKRPLEDAVEQDVVAGAAMAAAESGAGIPRAKKKSRLNIAASSIVGGMRETLGRVSSSTLGRKRSSTRKSTMDFRAEQNPQPVDRAAAAALAQQALRQAEEQLAQHDALEKEPSWKSPNSRTCPADVRERDGGYCVVTGNVDSCEGAHIVPYSINSSTGAVVFLNLLFYNVLLLFGKRFSDQAQELLGSELSSDKKWNVLLLNRYLHGLFDKGLFGLRPLEITRETDAEGMEYYLVHMSCHWLFRNGFDEFKREVHTGNINGMLSPTNHDKGEHFRRAVIDVHTNEPAHEGKKISIKHELYEDAQKMYIMLALRWVVTAILCLAGAAGVSPEDHHPDDDNNVRPLHSYSPTLAQAIEELAKRAAQQQSEPQGAVNPPLHLDPAPKPLPSANRHLRQGSSEESSSSSSSGGTRMSRASSTRQGRTTRATSIAGSDRAPSPLGGKIAISVAPGATSGSGATGRSAPAASAAPAVEQGLEAPDPLRFPKDPANRIKESMGESVPSNMTPTEEELAEMVGNLTLPEE